MRKRLRKKLEKKHRFRWSMGKLQLKIGAEMIMDAVPPPCIPLHDCRREDNGEIVGYLDFDDLPSGFKEGDPLYVQYAIKQDEEVEDTRIKILKAAAMADERNREKE